MCTALAEMGVIKWLRWGGGAMIKQHCNTVHGTKQPGLRYALPSSAPTPPAHALAPPPTTTLVSESVSRPLLARGISTTGLFWLLNLLYCLLHYSGWRGVG